MIELKDVSFQYENSDKESVSHINMSVDKGECILLCGKSGCGKTTVTKLINGLIPHMASGKKEGSAYIKGVSVDEIPMYQLSKTVGSVFQNPKSQFFNLDTDSELTFAVENQGLSEDEINQRLEEVTESLKIGHLRNRSIFELSGGEKQLIAVASVCISRPEILVLDEPTANLDLQAIHILKNMLIQLKAAGITIIIAEHRLSYLFGIVDRVLYMSEGKIEKEYTGTEFFRLSDPERIRMGLRRLQERENSHRSTTYHTKQRAIKIDNVSLRYGKKRILNNLSFTAFKGDIIGIVGKNGVGKSTFCRSVCGLHLLSTGSIQIEGGYVNDKERRNLSYIVMQDVNHQLFGDSVMEEMTISQDHPDMEKANELLREFALEDYKDHHPLALSGGQKQRLAIAVSLMLHKQIYLFDEPSSGLDYQSMCAIRDQIKRLSDNGNIIFLITHDMELLDSLCNRCLYLEKDRTIELFADSRSLSNIIETLLCS